MQPPPALLMDEIVEEVLFRLPPDEPAGLVRASAVCKPWRGILADPGFRRRYREFHGTPPVLGFFDGDATFVPISALLPDQPKRRDWIAVDCRHGRALFYEWKIGGPLDLIVLDPVTGHQRRVPSPVDELFWFISAVLCAAPVCDHHGCQGGCFRVAFLATDELVTSGWLYSSETRVWSELAPVHHPNEIKYTGYNKCVPSILVGDALYFNIDVIIKCQLGTLCLSIFEKPTNADGRLMTTEDGGLGFAAVVNATNLTLWSMETGPGGAMGWAKLRVIDLKILLPDGALWIPKHKRGIGRWSGAFVRGSVEGTQIIFVNTYVGCYMVDLKSGRARRVYRPSRKFFPYMRFYIPAMEASSPYEGEAVV